MIRGFVLLILDVIDWSESNLNTLTNIKEEIKSIRQKRDSIIKKILEMKNVVLKNWKSVVDLNSNLDIAEEIIHKWLKKCSSERDKEIMWKRNEETWKTEWENSIYILENSRERLRWSSVLTSKCFLFFWTHGIIALLHY